MHTPGIRNRHFDEHGLRRLANAIVLRTIKDAAAPCPPQNCTPHEWYLAQLQVVEWIPEYGEARSGAAYMRKHRKMQREFAQEQEAMEIKQMESRELAELENEVGELQSEQATLGHFLRAVGEASLGSIESALIRQRAIGLRLTALTAILDAKRALILQKAEPLAG